MNLIYLPMPVVIPHGRMLTFSEILQDSPRVLLLAILSVLLIFGIIGLIYSLVIGR
jgi:putative effector of murein hydrolase LrgA (UPF0299 family)